MTEAECYYPEKSGIVFLTLSVSAIPLGPYNTAYL